MKTEHWICLGEGGKKSPNAENVSLAYYFDSLNDLEELLISQIFIDVA